MTYFTIQELCRSDAAAKIGYNNYPTPAQCDCLVRLVENILDPARKELGAAITVTSGYRCPRLNTYLKGATSSQHLKGEAADLVCATLALTRRLFDILRRRGGFDQLIYEKGDDKAPAWVHVSYTIKKANRGEVLRTKNGKDYYRI